MCSLLNNPAMNNPVSQFHQALSRLAPWWKWVTEFSITTITDLELPVLVPTLYDEPYADACTCLSP
jgi:hypothetical protein